MYTYIRFWPTLKECANRKCMVCAQFLRHEAKPKADVLNLLPALNVLIQILQLCTLPLVHTPCQLKHTHTRAHTHTHTASTWTYTLALVHVTRQLGHAHSIREVSRRHRGIYSFIYCLRVCMSQA